MGDWTYLGLGFPIHKKRIIIHRGITGYLYSGALGRDTEVWDDRAGERLCERC